jgi:hypothetical protein
MLDILDHVVADLGAQLVEDLQVCVVSQFAGRGHRRLLRFGQGAVLFREHRDLGEELRILGLFAH